MAGLCRLAWMPEDEGEVGSVADGSRAKLLRVEASVSALEPIISEDDQDMMVGFYPPSLGSLRTDILEKMGELEGVSLEERAEAAEGYVAWSDDTASSASEEVMAPMAEGESSKVVTKESAPIVDEKLKEKIAADPRSALDF